VDSTNQGLLRHCDQFGQDWSTPQLKSTYGILKGFITTWVISVCGLGVQILNYQQYCMLGAYATVQCRLFFFFYHCKAFVYYYLRMILIIMGGIFWNIPPWPESCFCCVPAEWNKKSMHCIISKCVCYHTIEKYCSRITC
jgi:hypothetical protein